MITKEHLNFVSIKLQSSFVNMSDDLELWQKVQNEKKDNNLEHQSFNATVKLTTAKHNELIYYHFFYAAGSKINTKPQDEKDEKIELLEITATFCATYSSKIQLTEECVVEFSKDNVGYHVWPYWREFVGSTCSRLNINTIPIPLYHIASK